VRQAAKHLARTGQISIYRKGKIANPDDFKGVWRIGPYGEQPTAHDANTNTDVEEAEIGGADQGTDEV
jgi:Protein of unknown function (DUF3253)